jgi:hypothetical protein
MFLNKIIKYATLFIIRPDTIKDLRVQLDAKLRFHTHVEYIFSHYIRIRGLARTKPYHFLPLISY